MNKFEVGQRVRCRLSGYEYHTSGGKVNLYLQVAQICRLPQDESRINIHWENKALDKYWWDMYGGGGGGGGGEWMAKDFELAPPLFDMTKTTQHRDGRPAIVERTDDADRPYRATLDLGGQPVTLTYDLNGIFYPGFELPHDLVNA